MDWTLKDNMAGGLFFCAILTGRRGGHTPFCASRSANVRHECGGGSAGPRCSWQSHSRRMGADVGDESTKPRSVVQPLRLRIPS